MLLLLVLCATLRTLQGVPIPAHPHASSSAAIFNEFDLPEAPDDGEQQFRTVYTIVKSCLLTIFACVWTSAHPNINGPRDSGWACFKRKVVIMLCTAIIPEFVLWWALRQRWAAKGIVKMYNYEFARYEQTQKSIWEKIVRWFQPLSMETIGRGAGRPWTMTHAFFLQMGGFILYENEYPKEVLDYNSLAQLLRDKAIRTPIETDSDLKDRSTSDVISKAIVVVQTTWFVFQCLARVAQHLPLSELEVITIAFAVMNAAIYAVWWNKPQGVDMAICVPLKSAQEDVDNSTMHTTREEQHEPTKLSHPEPVHLSHPDRHDSRGHDDPPMVLAHEQQPGEHTSNKYGWLRRSIRDDHKQPMPVFLVRLPLRIVASMLRLLGKMMGDDSIRDKEALRVPMFYASSLGHSGDLMTLFFVATIFGAIHLIAWASNFRSHLDLELWRASAVVLTVAPVVPFSILVGDIRKHVQRLLTFAYALYFVVVPLYVASRFVVIFVALKAIRDPPREILLDVSWTSRLPHF